MLYPTFVAMFTPMFVAAAENCPCGWFDDATGQVYTHRIFYDFSKISDVQDVVKDTKAGFLTKDWMIYDYLKPSDNHLIRLDTKFEASNVQIRHGELQMLQKGYSDQDLEQFKPVSIAAMQTRLTDILHGTFRVEMKLSGYNGGTCASFFWYHDDAQELDIEIVTPGTSIVNETINYTTQPSVRADWSRIPGATFSMPLGKTLDDFRTHRFDCNEGKEAVEYFLDTSMIHRDTHNVPIQGGTIQLKLWSDGNRWWTGLPSKTDTILSIRKIAAYFNTTSSDGRQCPRGSRGLCKTVF